MASILLLASTAWDARPLHLPTWRCGVAAPGCPLPGGPLAAAAVAGRHRDVLLFAEAQPADSGAATYVNTNAAVYGGGDDIITAALVAPASASGHDSTAADFSLLWSMLAPHTRHLDDDDMDNLRLGLRVLIAKVASVQAWAEEECPLEPAALAMMEPSFRTPDQDSLLLAAAVVTVNDGLGAVGALQGKAAARGAATAAASVGAAEASETAEKIAAAASRAAADAPNSEAVTKTAPPLSAAAAKALVVLSSVQTAADLLRLHLDVEVVAAAMLSESAFTTGAPTWPCSMPTPFTLQERA